MTDSVYKGLIAALAAMNDRIALLVIALEQVSCGDPTCERCRLAHDLLNDHWEEVRTPST